MPDIKFFWLAHYKNGMQLKGTESIGQVPNIDDVKLFEVYIFNDEKELKYRLSVGLGTGMFYINSEKINPHPLVLSSKPVFRPIFFLIRQQKFELFGKTKKPKEIGFHTAGIRVGWQTTLNGKNYQRMMSWMEEWDNISITGKR